MFKHSFYYAALFLLSSLPSFFPFLHVYFPCFFLPSFFLFHCFLVSFRPFYSFLSAPLQFPPPSTNCHLQTIIRAIWFRVTDSISVYRLCAVNTQHTEAATYKRFQSRLPHELQPLAYAHGFSLLIGRRCPNCLCHRAR